MNRKSIHAESMAKIDATVLMIRERLETLARANARGKIVLEVSYNGGCVSLIQTREFTDVSPWVVIRGE